MKRKTVLLAILTWICAMPFAMRGYEPLPARYAGSMMPYDFSRTESPSWPDSLRPRYCAYVARHGARYMSGPHKFRRLETALRRAENGGKITKQGRRMLAMIDSVKSLSDGKWGELSPVGIAEQRRLGASMLEMFPAVAKDPANVSTLSSFVPRAMMTMYQFNHAMMLGNDNLEVRAASGRNYSDMLYFFATDSLYASFRKNGTWKEIAATFGRDHLDPAPVRSLFKEGFPLDEDRERELLMEMYSVLQSRLSMGMSAPTDEWMTPDQYRRCWLVSNLTHYLRNNVTPIMSKVCAQTVAPLVATIIDKANVALYRPHAATDINGYFGHAETLLPLLSVLRIPGCHDMPEDWNDLAEKWQLQNITPMAANMALFLLDSPSGTVYAAIRLNGRNVNPMGNRRFVPWDELAAYWTYLLSAY